MTLIQFKFIFNLRFILYHFLKSKVKRNRELGDKDDLKIPVRPIAASESEGKDYKYEGEAWSKETDGEKKRHGDIY